VKKFLFIINCFFALLSHSQSNIDSIESNLNNRKRDTTLFKDLISLSKFYASADSAKSFEYASQSEELAIQLKNRTLQADAQLLQAKLTYQLTSDSQKSIDRFQKALSIYRSEGQSEKELQLILELGYVYRSLGREDEEYEMYLIALDHHKEDNRYACVINNTIGVHMKNISEHDKAIYYMDKSEEYYNQIDNPDYFLIERQLSNDKNRGVVYRNLNSFDTAAFYFNRSLQKSIELNDSAWMARNYNSIAIMKATQGYDSGAIEMYEKSLAIKRALNYKDGVATTLSNLCNLYLKQNNLKLAQLHLEEALEISDEIPAIRKIDILEVGSKLYFKQKKYELAYVSLLEFINLRDSIQEVFKLEESKELEAKYNNEILQIEEEKLEAELMAADLREKSKAEQIDRQNALLTWGTVLGIVLIILIAITIRSNIKRKAANLELREKNEEISSKSEKIEIQKQQIEEKNQEIFDSINYAKRIQDAIMPNQNFVKKHLPNSFIYYEPKDVLAGDFYWMDVMEDTIIWAAADCTGHGIPGAMVSVVCHNALNRSVHEFGNITPGKILDCTRELVIETFEKSGLKVKDGMDIALCCYNKKSNELLFSGANNPLWVVRDTALCQEEPNFESPDGTKSLLEFKGDKQPIGLHFEYKPFKEYQIELKKGDLLYVFTDGYADQFGGEKGKKLKYKNLKKFLLEKSSSSIQKQGTLLAENFVKWKGDFEQLDDVCVIGVEL